MNTENIGVCIKLTLVNTASERRIGFGYGAARLLAGVEEHGSLNAAAKLMGMSYTKAWKLMRACEIDFGFPLMIRDGARGSVLTDDGKRLLSAYRLSLEELEDYAEQCFARNLAVSGSDVVGLDA